MMTTQQEENRELIINHCLQVVAVDISPLMRPEEDEVPPNLYLQVTQDILYHLDLVFDAVKLSLNPWEHNTTFL
jgi:hypothetical protein